MRKRAVMLGAILIVIIIGSAVIVKSSKNNIGLIQINLKNKTDQTIQNLQIVYSKDREPIVIDKINAAENKKLEIGIKDIAEGNVKLRYFNSKGEKQEVILVDYFEENSHMQCDADIISIDKSGNIKLNVRVK